MEIDGATWTALGGLAAACGTAIKVVYTRVINKTDLQISTLEVKLDKCEEKHAECEKAHKELGKRMAFVEGHLSAQGVVIPQGENS